MTTRPGRTGPDHLVEIGGPRIRNQVPAATMRTAIAIAANAAMTRSGFMLRAAVTTPSTPG